MEESIRDKKNLTKKHRELVNQIEQGWDGAVFFEMKECEDEFWFLFILTGKNRNRAKFIIFSNKIISKLYRDFDDQLSIIVGPAN